MSNFRKVEEFHKTFEMDVNDEPQYHVFDENPKLVKLRLSLIEEEVNELKEAVKNKDMTEVVDALADILYVVYGTGISLGITDMDKIFDLVHKSNMTKACCSINEAKATVKWYHDEYIRGNSPYDSPTYKKSKNGKYWIIYNKSTGKILKSIHYKPVDFSDVLCPIVLKNDSKNNK